MNDSPISQQIDNIISLHEGWKGELLTQLRAFITAADPEVFEEVKWKMSTRPEGLAVWSCNGILCFAEIWKDNVKLIFPKGASLKDPKNLFNSRLQSKDIRAVELKQGADVDDGALQDLIVEAIAFNKSKAK